MMARTKTPTQGRRLSDGKGKSMDIRTNYDTFFAIYSEEEGKRFCSLVKRNLSKPKYFDDEVLFNLGIKRTIDVFYNKFRPTQFITKNIDGSFNPQVKKYLIIEAFLLA